MVGGGEITAIIAAVLRGAAADSAAGGGGTRWVEGLYRLVHCNVRGGVDSVGSSLKEAVLGVGVSDR